MAHIIVKKIEKRGRNYYVYYNTPAGKRKRVSTHTDDYDTALKYADLLVNPRAAEKIITLNKAHIDYKNHSATIHSKSTMSDIDNTLKIFENYCGNIKLNNITPELIFKYLESRNKSAYCRNKDIRYLKLFFKYFNMLGYVSKNPIIDIKQVKPPERIPLFLSQLEFSNLIKATDNRDARDLFTFAVYTGLRRSELANLRWTNVHIKTQKVVLDNRHKTTKSKRIRAIPLNKRALEVIQRRDRAFEYVFTYCGKRWSEDYIYELFIKYAKLAELNPEYKFHTLRHTFASWIIQKGGRLKAVQDLLGHQDIKTTMIYAHLAPGDSRNDVDLI